MLGRTRIPAGLIIIVVLLGSLVLYLLWSIIASLISAAPENAALVTALLAFAGVLIAQVVNTRIAQSSQRTQQELEEQRARGEALQAYLEKVEESLTNKKLHESGERSYVSIATEAQTAALLERSDAVGKRIVVKFLSRTGLLNPSAHDADPIIRLDNTNLEGVDLTLINLRGVHLRGANLANAGLQGADLSESDLGDVDLRGANLTNADLSRADLSGANLLPYDEQEPDRLGLFNLKDHALPSDDYLHSLARLQEERLQGLSSRLTRRVKNRLLRRKPVTFTNLTDAKLDGANLTGAILANADLRFTRGPLDRKQIERAIGNDKTKLPETDEFKPLPPRWTTEGIEEQIKEVEAQVSMESRLQ
jgi:uncharacterized protein YjbI with pentapeptide repeats